MPQNTIFKNPKKVDYDNRWFTPIRNPWQENDRKASYRTQDNAQERNNECYVIDILQQLNAEEIESLSRHVWRLYSEDMTNLEHRPKVINALLSIDPKEREQFTKELLFLFAEHTSAHDRVWMTQMLANVKNPQERSKLAKNVHSLYSVDTKSADRAHLLHAFINILPEEQKKIIHQLVSIEKEEEATKILASLIESSKKISQVENTLKHRPITNTL